MSFLVKGLLLLNISVPPVNPNDIHVNENGQIIQENGTDGQSVINTLMDLGTQGTLKFVDWGTSGITIVFVAAVIMMIMAIIFKVGQWQKFAQTTMLWSFIAMLFMRAIPITILSFQSDADVDQAVNSALTALSHITIFIGMTGILLSFLFKFAFKLIEHPDYHRWSKNLIGVSILMIFFSVLSPYVFGIM